jgi:hypothetical protein
VQQVEVATYDVSDAPSADQAAQDVEEDVSADSILNRDPDEYAKFWHELERAQREKDQREHGHSDQESHGHASSEHHRGMH